MTLISCDLLLSSFSVSNLSHGVRCRVFIEGAVVLLSLETLRVEVHRVCRVDVESFDLIGSIGSLDYDLWSQNRKLFFPNQKRQRCSLGHACLEKNSPHTRMPKLPFRNVSSSLYVGSYTSGTFAS